MKIQTSEYSSSGAYPIIDQSMHEIAGWTDDERALVRIEKPVVIFGENFCQGADGIKILSTTENVIPKYLYYYLLAFPITPQGYNRHFSKLVEKEISIPELDVQQIIVSRIESEQKLVEANRKLIALFEQKIKERINRLWETNQKRPL
jgi:restriction endonuclease S subunit